MDEKEFNEHKKLVDNFKAELKELIKKHKITIKEHCSYPTAFHDINGVGEIKYYLVIDGNEWVIDNFIEILKECIIKV